MERPIKPLDPTVLAELLEEGDANPPWSHLSLKERRVELDKMLYELKHKVSKKTLQYEIRKRK